jgi:hypothetical protein
MREKGVPIQPNAYFERESFAKKKALIESRPFVGV